eukprot:jgi/Mesen1/2215/ME000152S01301
MYEKELEIACRAVRLASHLCQTVQRKLLAAETVSKADNSPVTVADYGSQALVSWALERALPPGTFSMVAEEDSEDFRKEGGQLMLQRITDLVNETICAVEGEGGVESSPPLTPGDVVAAIDKGGSLGGAVGRHWYAVALGLLDEGQVVLGVLGCPNLPMASIANGIAPAVESGCKVGCLFAATKGGGATVEPMDQSEAPRKDLTANIARVLGVTAPPVRIDSQAKYGAMARGDAAIYLRFPHKGYREKIWDHAAGAIVIQEAGGIVTDAAGQPLDFSGGRWLDLHVGIVATNPALMPIVLAAVQTVLGGNQPSSSSG